ncbi:Wadjet anti-phage system protein JetD domain-containing protein [Dongia sp.]|uniref:Wadjet anti-phage system protein JetD domain-containing protein n=1 Tax=Dongia sp. TaxID=1977262 RepID=UPI0035B1E7E5
MARKFGDSLAALNYMLDVYESQPERRQSILVEPDYRNMNAERADAFEKAMRHLERDGIIAIRMKTGAEDYLIRNVILKDPAGLYPFLVREPRRSRAEDIWRRISSGLGEMPDWVAMEGAAIVSLWSEHKPWRGLGIDDADDAETALKLAMALEGGVSPGTTYRAFSASHTHDSKALKKVESVVAAILRHALDLPPLEVGEEPLAVFGLSTYPDPILVRGPFVAGSGGEIDLSLFAVYAAVTAPNAETIAWKGDAPYVLTIENKASFNAYVHRIMDCGAVIFTGGWPSSATAKALKKIAEGRRDIPWYHWGDIDGGGLAIFRYLETEICQPAGISLKPHLMSIDIAAKHGQAPLKSRHVLRGIAESGSSVSNLAAWLLSENSRIVEQELIDPVSPVAGEKDSR